MLVLGLDWGGLVVVWPVVVPVVHLAGVAHAAHAVMHVRTAQGTIAWIFALLMLPWVAVPLYWILGRDRFAGYVNARRACDERLAETAGNLRACLAPAVIEADDRFVRLCQRVGGLPFTCGNHAELLVNGAEGFEAMLAAIGSARRYILMEFFIVHSDRIGTRVKEALERKAAEGVRVYFLYDEFGSRRLPKAFIRDLQEAGVRIDGFGATRGPGNRFQLNFRNHRKIVVVDGDVAFVGGLNIGDEYLGQDAGHKRWRDTHLLLRGPAVESLQITFVEDWFWAREEVLELDWKATPDEGSQDVLIVPTGPADPFESCQLFFVSAINSARERIWITSPYFVPDTALVTALQAAALRGVDVRILLPSEPDHRLVYLSSFSYYPDMLPAGVRIFRHTGGFLHEKIVLVDDAYSAVGTANLDNRSLRLNFEVIAIMTGGGICREVEQMLENDFADAYEAEAADFDSRPLWFRAACRLARLLAPVQ